MKTLLKIVAVPIVIAIAAGLIGGYMGFIPQLASVLGTNKPRDLGVEATKEDYNAYNSRAKYQVKSVKESETGATGVVFSGETTLDTSFSESELSGRLNYSEWKYMPVSDTQLKINEDGSVEFSALLRTDRLEGFIKAVGGVSYTPEEVSQALDKINTFASNPPIYAKFTAEVTNNKVDLNVEKVEVGRVAVPLDKVGGSAAVESLAQEIIDRTPGLNMESVTFSDGKMNFKGTAPAVGTMVTE